MKYKVIDLGPKVQGDSVIFRMFLPNVEPDADVYVVGSFCNWEPEDAVTLRFDSKSGLWKGEIDELEKGLYEYACVIKTGSWRSDFSSDVFARMTGSNCRSAFKVPAEKPARLDSFRCPSLDELVLYELDLDSFNNNFAGVRSRVVYYLSQLGVNGILFSPWIGTDQEVRGGSGNPVHFFAPENRYGSPYDLKVMINECHKAGIAVIMDIDLHAVSPLFGNNMMYPLFDVKPMLGRNDDSGEKIAFNYADELTREFVYNVCHWWLDEFNVDGFRFLNSLSYWDKADGNGFALLCKRLYEYKNKSGENLFLFADDTGGYDVEILSKSYANAVMNNKFTRMIHRMSENRAMREDFRRTLDLNQLNYPEETKMDKESIKNAALCSIERKDLSSLIVKMGVISGDRDSRGCPIGDRKNNWWKIKPYVISQFTGSGIPVIFNGQEIGDNRYVPDSEHDPFRKREIPWNYLSDFPGKDLFRFHQKLVLMRNKFRPLRSRNFFHYFTDAEKQLIVFKRYQDDESVVVAINFSNESLEGPIPFPDDGNWKEYLDDYEIEVEGGEAVVKIPARYGAVFYRE